MHKNIVNHTHTHTHSGSSPSCCVTCSHTSCTCPRWAQTLILTLTLHVLALIRALVLTLTLTLTLILTLLVLLVLAQLADPKTFPLLLIVTLPTLTLTPHPTPTRQKKRKVQTTTDKKHWRQQRKGIRGTGEDSVSPILDASKLIEYFSPGMKGAYINTKGSCVTGTWSQVGARGVGNITNHIIDGVHMMAKAFCPKDPLSLVQAVADIYLGLSKKQKLLYEAWSQQQVVKLLLQGPNPNPNPATGGQVAFARP